MSRPEKIDFIPCWEAIRVAGNDDTRVSYAWLERFRPSAKRVVNFGCWATWSATLGYTGNGVEPFALLWTLDADEVVVVDKNPSHIKVLKKRIDEVKAKSPGCFERCGRCFVPIVADMTAQIEDLESDYFDLAFCSRVLLQIKDEEGLDGVSRAVEEIARVVNFGGLVVSQESYVGNPYPDDYKMVFEQVGLSTVNIVDIPDSIWTPKLLLQYAIFEKLAEPRQE